MIGLVLAVGLAPALQEAPEDETDFASAFPEATERVWIGPDFYANRLMDWRVEGGRLDCVEGSRAKPMRTVQLLTRSLDGEGDFTIRVGAGPLRVRGTDADSWVGFLVGVGGPHVDWRTSALVHHWPGLDGGLIAAVDGTGRPVFRENDHANGPRGPRSDIDTEAWPELAPVGSTVSHDWDALPEGAVLGDVLVTLTAESRGERTLLQLEVQGAAGGTRGWRAAWVEVDSGRLAGSVGLVSHGSPRGDGRGFSFDDLELSGGAVRAHPERAFGPVLGAMYTVSGGVLKLTAQLGPLGPDDPREATLALLRDGVWETAAVGRLVEPSFTVPFRVEDWDASEAVPYRVELDLRTGPDAAERHVFPGTIRADPRTRDTFVLAGLSCQDVSSAGSKHWNGDHVWWPHAELVERVAAHDPDLLFFAGDQIYEGGLAGIVRKPLEKATLDYLYHWFRFVWSFRDLTRDRPTICLPDDHDVYHGNIWGNAGVRAPADGRFRLDSDRGGYVMPPEFVNTVHATQVSHLPDPVDPEPLAGGITVYFTNLEYGALSFAIVADRMFKSAPAVLMPEGRVENGWFQEPDFDPVTQADPPDAKLLGERQLAFLERWAEDWSSGAEMKVLLSQTVFHNVATIPSEASSGTVLPRLEYPGPGEYVEGDRVAADCDSNGWPSSGRDRALRIVRRALAFHVAGDQHLPSFTQYGIDDWRDGPYAFCVPAIANLWPRRFFPPAAGRNAPEGAPAYVGDHLDGFGNRMTVLAVANPMRSGVAPVALNDRNPGYGIVRFDRRARTITSECWPRWVDPVPGAAQFPGWPVTVSQLAGRLPAPGAWLPTVEVSGLDGAVLRIETEAGELLYSLPLAGPLSPPVPGTGIYRVVVREPAGERVLVEPAVHTLGPGERRRVSFEF